jgi:hypothetical protein
MQVLQRAQQTHVPSAVLCCGVLLLCLYLQYQCEDVLGDGQLLDALGVGLGRTDMVNVALAVKKLGEDPKKNVDTVSAGTLLRLSRLQQSDLLQSDFVMVLFCMYMSFKTPGLTRLTSLFAFIPPHAKSVLACVLQHINSAARLSEGCPGWFTTNRNGLHQQPADNERFQQVPRLCSMPKCCG